MNLQNIPSHNNEIRMMFTAGYTEKEVTPENNKISVRFHDEVFTGANWVLADNLHVGDLIEDYMITDIELDFSEDCYNISLKERG